MQLINTVLISQEEGYEIRWLDTETEEQESHVVLWGKNGSLLDRSGLIG